jgi:hypothetical protein
VPELVFSTNKEYQTGIKASRNAPAVRSKNVTVCNKTMLMLKPEEWICLQQT